MIKKPEIKISVVTKIDTTDWEFGRQILTAVCDTDPRLMPERVGNSEPVKVMVENIDSCAKHWAPSAIIDGSYGRSYVNGDFLWKRTKLIKSAGCLFHTSANKTGNVKLGWLILTVSPEKRPDWLDLFRRLCVIAQPDFATMHLFTDVETRRDAFGAESMNNFGVNDYVEGIPGVALKERGLANLSWATFFGKEFAAEVDVEKLRENGFDVEEISEGYLVKITSNLFDLLENFKLFSERRIQAKSVFRTGLFRINEEPRAIFE